MTIAFDASGTMDISELALSEVEVLVSGLVKSSSSLSGLGPDLVKRGLELVQELQAGEDEATWESNPAMQRMALDFYSRGLAKYSQGDYQRSQEDFSQAIALNPDLAHAYFSRACIRHYLGDYQGAINDYSEVVRVQPSFYHAYVSRAYSRGFVKDFDGAIADYTQSLIFNPNDAYVYLNRGLNYYYIGDRSAALADYNQAINLNPYLMEAWFNRGYEKLYLGDLEGALQDFNQAIALNPNFGSAYYQRAVIYSQLGRTAEATNDYHQALKLDPSLARYAISNDANQAHQSNNNYVPQISNYQNKLPQIAKVKILGVGEIGVRIADEAGLLLPHTSTSLSGQTSLSAKTSLSGQTSLSAQVEVWAIDMKADNLSLLNSAKRLLLSQDKLSGLGFGGEKNLGQRVTEQSETEIAHAVANSNLVIITANAADDIATGAIPVIANIAKKAGALTVGVLSQNISDHKDKSGIKTLLSRLDALMVIETERVFNLTCSEQPFDYAQGKSRTTDEKAKIGGSGEIIKQGIEAIVNLLTVPGLIMVNFDEVKTILSGAGLAKIAVGKARGKLRAQDAAKMAIDCLVSFLPRTQGIILMVKGGSSLSLNEVNLAASTVYEAANYYAKIVYGGIVDESLGDQLEIVVIITRFSNK